MIVVDADLVLRLARTSGQPATVSDLVRALFLADPDWVAPPLWRSDGRSGTMQR